MIHEEMYSHKKGLHPEHLWQEWYKDTAEQKTLQTEPWPDRTASQSGMKGNYDMTRSRKDYQVSFKDGSFYVLFRLTWVWYSRYADEGCVATVEEGPVEHLQDEGEVLKRKTGDGGAHRKQHTLQSCKG